MTPQLETVAITVGTYLFLRYLWEPRLLPIFDKFFKPYTKSALHSDLDSLIVYFSEDWLLIHVLPNSLVYKPLYKKIRRVLPKYVGKREINILDDVYNAYCEQYSTLERPKPIELIHAQDYITNTLLPILHRVRSQVYE